MNATQAAEFDSLLQLVKYQRLLVDYAVLACCTILFYDYLLTLHLEYTHIWRSKWSHTKVLFLLTRYTPLVNLYFTLYDQLAPNTSAETCNLYYHIVTWLIFIGVFFAEVILAVRTWVVWRQSRWVGGVLVLGLCGLAITACVCLSRSLNVMIISPVPYVGYRGCFVTYFSTIVGANFIALTVFDCGVMCLMCLSAFRSYRIGASSELLNIIHRDGIMFYFYLVLIAAGNIVVFYGFSIDLENLLPPWHSCMCSVFTTRIILNIRMAAKKGMGDGTITELHTKNDRGTFAYRGRARSPSMLFASDSIFHDDFALTSVTHGGAR